MKPMIFEHFSGKDICSTEDEARAVLGKTVNGVNEFIIYQDTDSTYPYISVLVNGEYAYLWFTPEEDHPGFQAYSAGVELDPDESTIFYVNTPTEEMEIPNEYVSSKETVLQAVLEFMGCTKWPASFEELPACVQWEEL